MLSISEANFIVIDVETTGSNPKDNRITDIACISVNNFEIIDTYYTLVNPHQAIPYFIQKMTGINSAMVRNAPEDKEVFIDVAELLLQNNTYFVAHNANFDYGFVKETIKRLNISFSEIPVICSLKLAKKVLPSNIKKNVAAIAEYFNIPIINRHRAFDDAQATAIFFIEMLHIIRDRYGINNIEELLEFQNSNKTHKATKINQQLVEKLIPYKKVVPEQSGVLMFIDKKGNLLHITKANNLKEHIDYFIEQCLNSVKNVKNILKYFHRLEWIETNNELETIITEYRKIKQFKPQFNFLYRIDLVNADNIKINEETQKILTKNFSMIVLLADSEQEKTIEICFIKRGIYKLSLFIGIKADIKQILKIIHDIYFTDNSDFEIDVDEMKFINNWLNKNDNISKTITISNELDEEKLCKKVEYTIRNFYSKNINIESKEFYMGDFLID